MTQLWEDTDNSYGDMMLFQTKVALEPRFLNTTSKYIYIYIYKNEMKSSQTNYIIQSFPQSIIQSSPRHDV